MVVFSGAALLHLGLDFPLHTHDARQHFWPVSDWVFESPYSYSDRRAHAGVIGPIEGALSILFAGVLLWRFKAWAVRALILILLAAELFSSGIWRFVF